MNRQFPIYTIENECQDCYKCVRHCHSKAIKIINARAAVIPELCVACGECVRVCPAHAKMIRSDESRVLQMLENRETPIYVSLAPSFPGYFKGITLNQLVCGLKMLGFHAVSETAHGAQLVSAKNAELLKKNPNHIYISSACPASVDYIRKYQQAWIPYITPVDSPVIAHCKLLRKTFGRNIKTVFIGPCAAKKNEADRMSKVLSLAITFKTLEQLFSSKEIQLDKLPDEPQELALGPAEEGRIYAIEGGMNDTMRDPDSKTRYISVSGLDNLDRMLQALDPENLSGEIFLETLACHGGCINGPAMPGNSSQLDALIATDMLSSHRTSVGREVNVPIQQNYFQDIIESDEPSEEDLQRALHSVGKFSRQDELNCGACGYDSCRDFARALLCGKAEAAMCHTYLRKNFERTSNALIKYIPAGVVIVNQNLEIIESNRHFAELIDEDTLSIFDSLGNLNSIQIDQLLDFSDLFESVITNGGEIEKFNHPFKNRILNISIFSITVGKTAGAVIQDVTKSELQREQIAEKAKEVIRKNVYTVQQVARLFGEHIADAEILLNDIAGTYSSSAKKEQQ